MSVCGVFLKATRKPAVQCLHILLALAARQFAWSFYPGLHHSASKDSDPQAFYKHGKPDRLGMGREWGEREHEEKTPPWSTLQLHLQLSQFYATYEDQTGKYNVIILSYDTISYNVYYTCIHLSFGYTNFQMIFVLFSIHNCLKMIYKQQTFAFAIKRKHVLFMKIVL